jgi:hypothetical protein
MSALPKPQSAAHDELDSRLRLSQGSLRHLTRFRQAGLFDPYIELFNYIYYKAN